MKFCRQAHQVPAHAPWRLVFTIAPAPTRRPCVRHALFCQPEQGPTRGLPVSSIKVLVPTTTHGHQVAAQQSSTPSLQHTQRGVAQSWDAA